MPENFFSVLTSKALEKYTAADAGGPIVNLTEFAVGDSGGAYFNPLPTQTTLVNELWRGAINAIHVHPNNANWMVVEALIPAADGGFDIREAGLFDAAGDLIAAAKYPLTTKPAPGSGSEKDLYVRLIFERANAAAVTQQIDPSVVMATKEYVDTRDWRESVRAATMANIVDLFAGAPNTLDGVALAVGDRLLVKDQSAGAENGIYVVQTLGTGADGSWVRSTDADNSLDISANFSVAVEEGTTNADSIWMLTTNHPITLGATPLTFRRMITQTELDAHSNRTDNPHAVSAAQAGAEPAGTAAAGMAAHEAAADPHPQYETGADAQARVDAHASRTDNPHNATAAQVGAAAAGHNHDTAYLGKTAQAVDSDKLGGIQAASYGRWTWITNTYEQNFEIATVNVWQAITLAGVPPTAKAAVMYVRDRSVVSSGTENYSTWVRPVDATSGGVMVAWTIGEANGITSGIAQRGTTVTMKVSNSQIAIKSYYDFIIGPDVYVTVLGYVE